MKYIIGLTENNNTKATSIDDEELIDLYVGEYGDLNTDSRFAIMFDTLSEAREVARGLKIGEYILEYDEYEDSFIQEHKI